MYAVLKKPLLSQTNIKDRISNSFWQNMGSCEYGKLHGDAPESCLRKSAEKYNNIWGAFLAAGNGELHHCEK